MAGSVRHYVGKVIRKLLIEPWNENGEAEALAHLKQGDLMVAYDLPIIATNLSGLAVFRNIESVVLVSQTCDLVQDSCRTAQVAPVVRLDEKVRANALARRSPRYVPVTYGEDDNTFVDLDYIATIDKANLRDLYPIGRLQNERAEREFRRDVGRRATRFAFPDAVVPWLKPLTDIANSKKESSAEGRMFAKVEELRVESVPTWERPPYSLVLIVLLPAGELPVFEGDELPELPENLKTRIRPNGRLLTSGQIAGLLEESADPIDRYYLWQALGESWASRCVPKASGLRGLSPDEEEAVRTAVAGGSIAAEVVSVDEFTMARLSQCEVLDLAHLSVPRVSGTR